MIGSADDARALHLGQALVRIVEPPIDRVQIAWHMVASYDLNPIHVDEPFAHRAGFTSVIGQGMLPLGFLARELVRLVDCSCLHRLEGDFVGPVMPGDVLTTELAPIALREVEGGVELDWSLSATAADGRPRVRGRATTRHRSAAPGPIAP
jgi:acyl dehydratase